MVYLATDKQTYADLKYNGPSKNEHFFFSLFSKTETKEGKSADVELDYVSAK